jgi:hypothetical protein
MSVEANVRRFLRHSLVCATRLWGTLAGYSTLKIDENTNSATRLDSWTPSQLAQWTSHHKHPSILPSIEERVTSLRILRLIMLGSHPRDVGMHINPPIWRLHLCERDVNLQ